MNSNIKTNTIAKTTTTLYSSKIPMDIAIEGLSCLNPSIIFRHVRSGPLRGIVINQINGAEGCCFERWTVKAEIQVDEHILSKQKNRLFQFVNPAKK